MTPEATYIMNPNTTDILSSLFCVVYITIYLKDNDKYFDINIIINGTEKQLNIKFKK